MEASSELELIGGSFAVQTDKWPASCFPLGDARDPAPPLLLLATVSRKCLPTLLFLLRVNKLFYSLSGLREREVGGRWRRRRGEVAVGTREREREWDGGRERASEREGERERGEVSIEECAWASLRLTQPR